MTSPLSAPGSGCMGCWEHVIISTTSARASSTCQADYLLGRTWSRGSSSEERSWVSNIFFFLVMVQFNWTAVIITDFANITTFFWTYGKLHFFLFCFFFIFSFWFFPFTSFSFFFLFVFLSPLCLCFLSFYFLFFFYPFSLFFFLFFPFLWRKAGCVLTLKLH